MAPPGKMLESFLLDTLETAFWMRKFNHKWTQSRHFFPKIRVHSFNFQKRGGETPPFPPLVAPLNWILFQHLLTWKKNKELNNFFGKRFLKKHLIYQSATKNLTPCSRKQNTFSVFNILGYQRIKNLLLN